MINRLEYLLNVSIFYFLLRDSFHLLLFYSILFVYFIYYFILHYISFFFSVLLIFFIFLSYRQIHQIGPARPIWIFGGLEKGNCKILKGILAPDPDRLSRDILNVSFCTVTIAWIRSKRRDVTFLPPGISIIRGKKAEGLARQDSKFSLRGFRFDKSRFARRAETGDDDRHLVYLRFLVASSE